MSNRDLIHSSTLQEICGRHHYLVNRYRTSVLQIIMPVMDIYFVFRNHNPVLSSFMTYHTVCNKSSMMVPNVEQKLITLSEHPSSSPVFVGFVLLNLQFSVQCFVDRCFFLLHFLLLAIVLSVLLLAIVVSVLLLAIVVSVLLYTDFDQPFGIFKPFL